MAIIVNKEEKRRFIALASKDFLLDHGIKEITIAKIAKTAGVGKGTIYEYFSNKEDIVFEIISVFIAEHEKRLYELISEDTNTKEKIKTSLFLLYSNEYYQKQLLIYREFLAISLTSDEEEMMAFNRACRERFIAVLDCIMDEAISKGEVVAEAKIMVPMLHTYSVGLVVETKTDGLDPQVLIDTFVHGFFTLIQKKDTK